MSEITNKEAQVLILNTFREFTRVLHHNRLNPTEPFVKVVPNLPDWVRVLNSKGFSSDLFDGLCSEGYNYLIEKCYELADLYNLSTKDRLRGKIVADIGNHIVFPVSGRDGETPIVVLELIAKHREHIKYVASKLGIDPLGIASVIFQEKYYGIFAFIKNAGAYIYDGGVNDNTRSDRSYGLAEMQLRLAAELLGEDINIPGTRKKMFDILQDDNQSIMLIGLYIKRNEEELEMKLKGAVAGGVHNMGAVRYKEYLEGKRELDPVASRSVNFQKAIQDALNGNVDYNVKYYRVLQDRER